MNKILFGSFNFTDIITSFISKNYTHLIYIYNMIFINLFIIYIINKTKEFFLYIFLKSFKVLNLSLVTFYNPQFSSIYKNL